MKGDTAFEGDSLEQYSSIFTGGELRMAPTKFINFNHQLNCSEGVAGGHASSPIRESILRSRRNSEDYGTLARPRSQHSLIVESLARILDDTALEQRGGDRENLRLQSLNEPNFKTGPPSAVHQLMHEEQTMALNSHFYADLDNKWNNQFDLTSFNSLPLTTPGNHGYVPGGQKPHQTRQGDLLRRQTSGQNLHHTFTSPGGLNNSHGLWNNQLHQSTAFHDMSLRHIHSQSNPFSVGDYSKTMPAHSSTVADTWRLTYNPHPLLPR